MINTATDNDQQKTISRTDGRSVRKSKSKGGEGMTTEEFYSLPTMLTVKEMCQALRIGRNRGYELVNKGKVHSIRYGSSIRIPQADVADILGLSKEQKSS